MLRPIFAFAAVALACSTAHAQSLINPCGAQYTLCQFKSLSLTSTSNVYVISVPPNYASVELQITGLTGSGATITPKVAADWNGVTGTFKSVAFTVVSGATVTNPTSATADGLYTIAAGQAVELAVTTAGTGSATVSYALSASAPPSPGGGGGGSNSAAVAPGATPSAGSVTAFTNGSGLAALVTPSVGLPVTTVTANPGSFSSYTIANANTWQPLFMSATHDCFIQNNNASGQLCIGTNGQTGSFTCSAISSGASLYVLAPGGTFNTCGRPQPAWSVAGSATGLTITGGTN